MICNNCGTKWADFPESDFTLNDDGIIPKSPEATSKRLELFESDKRVLCPDCLDET